MNNWWRRRRAVTQRLRGLFVSTQIRRCGGHVGRGLTVEGGLRIRQRPHSGWQVGSQVHLGVGVVLDVWGDAELEIGDNVKVMHYCVIGAKQHIEIGARSQIGECSTIRDANHQLSRGADMLVESLIAEPVFVGPESWIGRGVAVLAGANVGKGAVIGANSVVTGVIPEFHIAAGAPARVVRKR